MFAPLEIPTLVGLRVRLEPLQLAHVEALVAAASEERSTYGFTVVPQGHAAMREHVSALLRDFDAGLVVPFVQVDVVAQRVVGMTRYLTLRYRDGGSEPYAVEIGGTWLTASAQRSGINTGAKFLLFSHAFDAWRVTRVDLKTDNRNERAKIAISRLGATFEGVLRHWQPSHVLGEEMQYRDTAMYSVIREDWPRVSSQFFADMGR